MVFIRRYDSLSSNVERRQKREIVTIRKREQQIIEERKEAIARLDKKAHLYQGKQKQKIDEEVAYTLPLECWGFGRK